MLQKPEAMTTFGQSDVQKHKILDYRNIQPARGGQLTPAWSGQGHRLFQLNQETTKSEFGRH